jgi:hypothetical protein
MAASVTEGFNIPDGNEALRDDIPVVVELIERTARWVNPETFRRLPVWAPHTARGRPLYDARWTRRYTNTRKATGVTAEKFEGNVAALQALVAALDVASPKPKNWTVCHIWGYDDPSFAQQSSVLQDPRYFSCVANMVWLPTPLKGFTDTLLEIKAMLRVCAFHLYGWACEHPLVAEQAAKVTSGWIPDGYPKSWPSPDRLGVGHHGGVTVATDRGTEERPVRVEQSAAEAAAAKKDQLAVPRRGRQPALEAKRRVVHLDHHAGTHSEMCGFMSAPVGCGDSLSRAT